jgi:soluble lytic murein transglycosylase-like protein
MTSLGILLRASAVFGIIAAAFTFTTDPSRAEDAAAFFRKDKTGWSAAPTASAKPAANSKRRVAKRRHKGGGVALRGSRTRFVAAARQHGVPVRLALAVIATESRGNCRAVGRRGELGPLQIKPRTARGLGYRGPASALRSCGAGLYWGMKHLAISYRKCGSAVLHNKGLAGSCSHTAYSRKVIRLASRI